MIVSLQLVQKSAVRFAKCGPAIYHSHHDMIRFWERAVKRADLPLRLTQGFNPRPRIIFPHALGLGIASRHEEAELELHSKIAITDLLTRLRQACGDTLEIIDAYNLPPLKKSRQLVASSYRISGWDSGALEKLPGVAEEILAMPVLEVERGATDSKRTLDIRPHVRGLFLDNNALLLQIAHTRTGSARPDEIAKFAAAKTDTDWHDLLIEKTGMTLE